MKKLQELDLSGNKLQSSP
ncbi:MAG: hypothetical protein ACTSW1_18870 [Candidatus Hodarchaeales archaeon]